MSTHLTDTELGGFRTGALAADDLLRVDDHLAACEACRRRARTLAGAVEAFDDVREQFSGGDDHLSEEDLLSFAGGAMVAGRAEEARVHLARCRTCALQVDGLRAWAARPPRPAIRWLPLAAAILLAVLIPAVWITSGGHRNAPTIEGLDALAPADRARVQEAIDRGAAALPSFLPPRRGDDVRMGPTDRAGRFRVRSPLDTSTLTDRPIFEWDATPGASAYRVTIFDDHSNPIASSPATSETTWTPDRPLPRGRTYVWQVTTTISGRPAFAPAAPAPPAVFHVLDAGTASTLERLEREHADAHLALGILYMEAGVRDLAVRHLQQVPPGTPHSDVATRSLERLVPPASGPRER